MTKTELSSNTGCGYFHIGEHGGLVPVLPREDDEFGPVKQNKVELVTTAQQTQPETTTTETA